MKMCSVTGCSIKHFALELCRKHHARFKRHGTTESKYDKSGYDKLGGVKDVKPGRRGSLAVNIINDIKYKAIQRGKSWQLTHVQAFDLITRNCTYCDHAPKWPTDRVGIDRIDNNVGYHIDNCVSCCFTCNSAKGVMSREEFKDWVDRIYKFINNLSRKA